MGGEYCPYCGNTEESLLTYITKDKDHHMYNVHDVAISFLVCERCEKWFRLVSLAGAIEACLKWEDKVGLG